MLAHRLSRLLAARVVVLLDDSVGRDREASRLVADLVLVGPLLPGLLPVEVRDGVDGHQRVGVVYRGLGVGVRRVHLVQVGGEGQAKPGFRVAGTEGLLTLIDCDLITILSV